MVYYLRLRATEKVAGPVVLCLRLAGKRKYITLPVKLFLKEWVPAPVAAVRATSPELRAKAEQLRDMLQAADFYLSELQRKGLAFSLAAFRAAVLGKLPVANGAGRQLLRAVCMDYLGKNDLSYIVRSLYLRVTTWAEKLHPGVSVSEIDFSFLGNFWAYCVKRGNNKNSANRKIQTLKTLCSWAEKSGLPVASSRQFFKLQEQEAEKNFLSLEEIGKLETLVLSGNLEYGPRKLAGAFLFACLTGLRYAEVVRLANDRTFLNEEGLKIKVKGGKTLHVPISRRARLLVEGGHLWAFGTNQHANRGLPAILEKIGVRRKITFHCARHSFAVCSLRLGVKVEVLQTLLGHSKIATTMIYARIVDTLKEEAVRLWDK